LSVSELNLKSSDPSAISISGVTPILEIDFPEGR
jgi:hypothetical protein